ncbi:MAG: type II secretion system F family protein [Candidatus Woykebacteria bacterium]
MKLPFFSKTNKLSADERLAVVEGLSIMLAAGVPILEALDSLVEDVVNKGTKEIIKGLSNEISGGKSLAEAMAAYPLSFNSVLINIVKSGEESGKLEQVLEQLAANIKSDIETNNNIKSALFYPVLVMIVLVGVSFYMFTFALPRIAKVFTDLAINLPAYSAFVLKSSLFMEKYYLYVLAVLFVLLVISIRLLAIDRVRQTVFSILAKVPTIRSLIRFMDLSRFTNTTALLLSSGIPIIRALEISKEVVISPKLRFDIGSMTDLLAQGENLSEAMKKSPNSFPALLRRVVGVGEETGSLDKSLMNISGHYEKKFTDIVKNLTVLLEPLLLVVIGVVVGIVLFSIIAPIYQLIGQISPQ